VKKASICQAFSKYQAFSEYWPFLNTVPFIDTGPVLKTRGFIMRIIRASEHKTVPWKNGGGTATNIIASPDGAGFDAFDWRLSGAHVGRDGPFSIFPDVNRTMVILSGEALALHGLAPEPIVLTTLSAPFDFPGDVPVSATLPAGPVDDLNIMSHRGKFRHSVRRSRLSIDETIAPKGTLLVYVEAGTVFATRISGRETLGGGDTLVSTTAVALSATAGSSVVVINIWPV
jgi:uncharacterized protein